MDKVEQFINKRFPMDKDANWMNGNCYWFAKILTTRFTHLVICYHYTLGHFVAVDKKNHWYYDFEGKHGVEKRTLLTLNYIKRWDPRWYRRLVRDCIE